MSELQQITGIGPTRAADLAAHNIDTFQALATADAGFLVKTMEVTPTMIAGWQKAAAALAADPVFSATDRLPIESSSPDTVTYEYLLTGRVKR